MTKTWDVFISHAREDNEVARPLAERLTAGGLKVWLDAQELRIGDSLSSKIDEGLAQSRFGVVVISPAFLTKFWTKKELAGLRAREEFLGKVILPVWHDVDKALVARYSPSLADMMAVDTRTGIFSVAEEILKVVLAPGSDSPSVVTPSPKIILNTILGGTPNKSRLLDFLSIHRSISFKHTINFANYIIEDLEFHGIKFDAYSPHMGGHGNSIALVMFSDFWGDVYANEKVVNSRLLLDFEDLMKNIKIALDFYNKDTNSQDQMRRIVIARRGHYITAQNSDPKSVPGMTVEVFASRRQYIDMTDARRALWTKMRSLDRSILLHTYDYLIEQILNEAD